MVSFGTLQNLLAPRLIQEVHEVILILWFVDQLQLSYSGRGSGGPCARANAEIAPSWNISGMQMLVRGKSEITVLFVYSVEMIIASGAREKEKDLHCEAIFPGTYGDLKRFFLPFLKHQ